MLALPGLVLPLPGRGARPARGRRHPGRRRQDPASTATRTPRRAATAAACRCPGPSTDSYGFGADGAHLPQPAWFSGYSVAAQDGAPDSTLELYREALALRAALQTAEELEWVPTAGDVLHFVRPGGWHCVTNFGTEPVALPEGCGRQQRPTRGRRAAGEDDGVAHCCNRGHPWVPGQSLNSTPAARSVKRPIAARSAHRHRTGIDQRLPGNGSGQTYRRDAQAAGRRG